MIKIFGFNKNKNEAKLHFKGKHFRDILEIIKSDSSIVYDKKNIEWKVPIQSIQSMIDSLCEIKGEKITIDKDIYEAVNDSEKRKKELLKIKNRLKNVEFKVKTYNDMELYPFQKVGAAFLYLKRRALLADVVGLGKTVQALAAVEKRFEKNTMQNCIIVCPKSLIKKWQKDIKKFFGRDAMIIGSGKRARMQSYSKFEKCKHNYLIMNYEPLRMDEKYLTYMFNEAMGGRPISGIIFDEIQYLKNYTAKRSIAARNIANLSAMKVMYGLSATYIETGLENLFGVFLVLDRSVFGDNFYRFQNHYLELDYWGRITGYKNVEDVAEKINIYTIRRHKEQVIAQLPKVNYINYNVDLTAQQYSLIDDIKERILDEINDSNKRQSVVYANAMTQLGLMNQACLSAELFEAGNHSGKMDEVLNIMEGMDSESKIVIFCHYQKMVEIICRELMESKYGAVFMHGKSEYGKTLEGRYQMIDYWGKTKECRVLVTSDILAEGVDLVEANYLINFDLLWNPAKMAQRNGRIDRISQKASQITIINLISTNTVEEKIFERLEERKELASIVMDGGFESQRISNITLNDIRKFFNK